MIIEQAFFALPELLLGNYYAVQDYEAGIVGVFSMAILQELNGRNVNHPIRHLQAERRYNPNLSRRADLYVNSRQLMVANRRLGNYGWRHYNWIEAKFYRNKSHVQRHATNKSTHSRTTDRRPDPAYMFGSADIGESGFQWQILSSCV